MFYDSLYKESNPKEHYEPDNYGITYTNGYFGLGGDRFQTQRFYGKLENVMLYYDEAIPIEQFKCHANNKCSFC